MKGLIFSTLVGSALGLSTFGPKHCVSVYKNEQTGTCVIQTNCNGVNLDNVEFAFTCQLPNMLQKHSFGKGGFDAVEEFDTSVKCDECGIPAEVTMSLEAQKAKKAATTSMVEGQKKGDKVTYGPDGCISTWLEADKEKNDDGEHGSCQVETKCGNVTNSVFSEYPMGLVCVDKDKMPTRHLFGSNSFDKSEKFDTLIRCTTCLGLDKVSESITLEATVKSLAKEVYEIKDEVYKLEKNVDGTLSKKGAATTETATTTAAAAEAAASLSEKKRNLRGSAEEETEEEDSQESEQEETPKASSEESESED